MEGGKFCPECGEVRPLDQFRIQPSRRDGLSQFCLVCHPARSRVQRGGQQVCRDCGKTKPLVDFGPDKHHWGIDQVCLDCRRAQNLRACAAYRRSQGRLPLEQFRGEAASNVKLTEPQVLELRDLYRDGVSIAVLAQRFGIARGSVRSAAVGRSWAHLPNACEPRGQESQLENLRKAKALEVEQLDRQRQEAATGPELQTQRCLACQQELPLWRFSPKGSRGRRQVCRHCVNAKERSKTIQSPLGTKE